MRPPRLYRILLAVLFTLPAGSQTAPPPHQKQLSERLRLIAAHAHGTVSIACSLPGVTLPCDLNPGNRPPMQSVFKLPLTMALLHQMETGHAAGLTLASLVRFQATDRIPHTNSALQDKYPAAEVDVPLREVMRLAVALSDNAASEILLRLVGGPQVVTQYITNPHNGLGVSGFQLLDGEKAMAQDDSLQYRNTWEPQSAVTVLERLRDGKALNTANTKFVLDLMQATTTGPHRIRAGLPPDVTLRHKTGTAGVVFGVAAATNDIGLITLPDGRILTLAIFVTDAHASESVIEAVIAHMASVIYQAALESK